MKDHFKLNEVEISEYTGNISSFINNNSGFLIKSGSLDTMTTHQTVYYHVYMVKDLSKGFYDGKNWKEQYLKFVVPLKKEREKKRDHFYFKVFVFLLVFLGSSIIVSTCSSLGRLPMKSFSTGLKAAFPILSAFICTAVGFFDCITTPPRTNYKSFLECGTPSEIYTPS
jgi:hypothetical protein